MAGKAAKKGKTDSFTITLEKSKSTKGTHVFADTDEDGPIPTLYIRKAGISEDAEVIEVTIEVVK